MLIIVKYFMQYNIIVNTFVLGIIGWHKIKRKMLHKKNPFLSLLYIYIKVTNFNFFM